MSGAQQHPLLLRYYKMRHLGAFANNVRHQGLRMWRTARHIGSELDRHIHTAASIYGAIQPGLRAAGIDTRHADKQLKTGYDLYSRYAENVRDGVDVIDGIAGNLRGNFVYR